MTARVDLAAAVNAVDTFTAHEYVTADTDPGTVYVRLDRIDYPDPWVGVAYWQIVLVLPQDLGDAERYLDEHLAELRTAVEPHLVVKSLTRFKLDLPGVGPLVVASLNGHREAD